jgi:sec-independent protein translocase protein TatA
MVADPLRRASREGNSRKDGGIVTPMPFGISIPELLILLLVLLLVFGAKRLPEMGRSLGKGMREFKDSVTGVEESVTNPTPTAPPELPSAPSEPAPRPHDEAPVEENERETVR